MEKRASDGVDELVVRARMDSGALSELYDIYYGRILSYCRKRLYCVHTAQDITSEVFLAVARKMRTFSGNSEAEFCRWLYTIATNQCNSYLRKTLRRKEHMSTITNEYAGQTGSNYTSDIDRQTLYKAIRQLKEDYQSIITLRFFEKISHNQIAAILDMNPITVRVKQGRALSKLKKLLGSDFAGGGDSNV